MSASSVIPDALAAALAYPAPGSPDPVAPARSELRHLEPAAADLVDRFAELLATLGPSEREELYVRTFDLNPAAALELGWHLYGEDYRRGAFLVRMRGLMRELGVEESSELPDHLAHVLRVLGRLDRDEAASLATAAVAPALAKLRGAVPDDNPYGRLLDAIQGWLAAAFGGVVATAAILPMTPVGGPTGLEGGHP